MRVALVLCLAFVTTSVQAQQVDLRRTVSVEGVAEAYMPPDRAMISIGVETEGKDASIVKKNNDKAIRGVMEALTAAGVDMKDIQTSNLTLEPVYNWRQEGYREFIKYVMRNTVVVTVRDLARLDRVLDASVTKGSNLINNISFEVSAEKSVRDSLRIAAAKDAKTKAEALATALGAVLGKPMSVTEQSPQQPIPMYQKSMRMMAESDSGPTVSGGQLVMRAAVNATFELE